MSEKKQELLKKLVTELEQSESDLETSMRQQIPLTSG